LELSRYIHLNPVRAGVLNNPEDYKWSSYGYYLGKEKDSLVDTELILSQFKSAFKDEHKSYEDFVNEKLKQIKEKEDWLQIHLKRQRFLGDRNFIKMVLGKSEKAPDPFLRKSA
jgi:hypothetical protein